jgi:DNA-binding MarR family transcriptional regulator
MTRRTSGRDLIDGLAGAWRREMPGLNRPEYELGARAVRLAVLLEDVLAAELAPRDLLKTDFAVLSALLVAGAPYELRPSDLKDRLLLTSGGVTTVLKRLEKAGLIEREQDTADGRSSRVRLTDTGIETAGATVRAWTQAEARFFQAVPPEVVQAATDALREVLVAVGDLEPAAAPARKRRTRSSQKTLMAT